MRLISMILLAEGPLPPEVMASIKACTLASFGNSIPYDPKYGGLLSYQALADDIVFNAKDCIRGQLNSDLLV